MLLKRPVTAIILIIAVFIFGGIALSNLQVNLLPEVESPRLLVRTEWSGAAPSEIEQRINEPLTSVLSAVQGLKSVRSFARQGQSIILLTFEWGHNMDLAFLNVREKLSRMRSRLPQQSGRPQLVHNAASDRPIATLGITLKEQQIDFRDRLALKRWTQQVLARRLEQADGIAQVVLVGEAVPEIEIRFRAERLNRYGLTLGEVQNAVQQANLFSAPGELRQGTYRYSLKIESRIQSLDDLRQTPLVSLGSGKILELRDVAQVSLVQAEPTSFALVNGQRVLSVLVKKEYGANTVQAYNTMLPLLDQLEAQNPDVQIQVLEENASFIYNTIINLLKTLLIGALLAFIVLFLFLDDYRTPLTIGIAIPVSIFLTFFVMYLTGIQLNIVSLSGLTLGVGMLVDNAIIALENINRYREMGHTTMEAAAQGTREVALAMSASTFTNIAVFLPLVFMGGLQGAFFRDLAWTLSISLLASLAVAIIILPVLVVQVQKDEKEGTLLGFSNYFDRLRNAYENSLMPVISRRAFMAFGMLALLAAGIFSFVMVDKQILPGQEPEQVRYKVRLPANTSIYATQSVARKIMQRVPAKQGEPVRALGGYTDQTNLSKLSAEGLNKFILTVPVTGYGQAEDVQQRVNRFFRQYPGWYAERLPAQSGLGVLPGTNQPDVIFRLVGENRTHSERLAPVLEEKLSAVFPNIELEKQYQQMVRTYRLQFNSEHLQQLGITQAQVINYLESLTRGSFVTDWVRQDENIEIQLVSQNQTVYDPENITLEMNGLNIPLSYVAEVRHGSQPEQLERIKQTPVLSYVSNLDFDDWLWGQSEINEVTQSFARQTGTQVNIGGASLGIASLLKQMGLLLLISVLIIYIIMAIQFESLKYPFIIICDVPFAWVGAFLALWLAGVSLNALSFMGILILTGICINDAILKVDFMRRYKEKFGNVDKAIEQAGLHRFRPIMMTTLTTIIGLIPMLIPIGDGYTFRLSLALALAGGMLFSTPLTLYIIPTIFRWMESGGRKQDAGSRM